MNAEAKNPNLLTEPELMAWLGYKRRLDLLVALRDLRIPYALGKGGIVVSTVQAVNAGLLGTDGVRMESDPVEF
ncbi:hypothetical protein SAMN02949497_4249 [Methylomagnum ishizawai]|uniref:DUF4224 domain-containing protein n=1 Tax=Methylomagnum ishizawai TaxID=1760988 RepID=A0A1Y6D2L1_9GAMM|nr:hypothetical protein [Methylomagnum ishizawai]SMF96836.1 hypothetical protein SAMN02949497_4249 [Methylomagnum ishizawai]